MSPTSYRTAPPRVTERNTNGSITLRLGPGTSTVFAHHLVVPALAAVLAAGAAQQVVRTADPVKRGLEESDFPRTVKVADNIYTYEDFHAGPEKFTTTDLFVVTTDGVLVADGQGSPAATKGLIDAIRHVTDKPLKYVVICSDHGDHTA